MLKPKKPLSLKHPVEDIPSTAGKLIWHHGEDQGRERPDLSSRPDIGFRRKASLNPSQRTFPRRKEEPSLSSSFHHLIRQFNVIKRESVQINLYLRSADQNL